MIYEGAVQNRELISLRHSARDRIFSIGLFLLLSLGLKLELGLKSTRSLVLFFGAWFAFSLIFPSLIPVLQRRRKVSLALFSSRLLDAVLATTACWLAGGAEWLGFVACFLMVVFGAAYLKPGQARQLSAFCFAVLAAYLILVQEGLTPSEPLLPPALVALSLPKREAAYSVFLAVFGVLCFTVDRIAGILYQREKRLEASNARLHGLNEQLTDKHFSLLCSQQDLILANEKLRLKNLEVIKSQEVIQTLAFAVEAKDNYTQGHSQRVADYAVLLARELGLSAQEQSTIRHGCTLHDIGKINISDLIIRKKSALSADELEQMKRHPVIGEQICQPLSFARPFLDIIRHHHERMDGRGYPDGLKGDEISIPARVAAIADAWDAMTSDRPYRNALDKAEALRRLRGGAGTQWDPRLVEVFAALMEGRSTRHIHNTEGVSLA
jgi:putative nucleotidyltransferase with HDIG domain